MHLSDEVLSAYLDRELPSDDDRTVSAHLERCGSCTRALEGFAGLDRSLVAAPALLCATALPLVSARLDGELDAEDARATAVHLRACADCRMASAVWKGLETSLAALPREMPSARVDAALAPLRREPVRRPAPAFGLPDWPLRAAVAVAVAIAVVVAPGLQRLPETVAVPAESAFVASVQQSVLDPRTGTLYVLRPEMGAVDALDAVTLASRTVITVGGRPTALALSQATNSILVLDASAKTVTEIDASDNSVRAAVPVSVPGRPTSLQVDGSSGKLVITSIISTDPGPAGPLPAPSTPPTTTTGAVSVVDVVTKKIETINQVDLAPRQVVLDPDGKRALLVSTDGTTVVDAATYKPLERAAGGIAGAFSGTGGEYAILSARGGSALVSLSAHAGLSLAGLPRAIAALPNGAFAVLTELGGRGRITLIGTDGTVGGVLDGPTGRDMTYDPTSGQISIVSAAGVTNVAVPSALAAQPAQSGAPAAVIAPAQTNAPASASPGPAVAPSPAPAPSIAPTASAPPTPAASPTAPITGAPVAAVPPPAASPGLVPTGARLAWTDTYIYAPLGGKRAALVAGDTARIWVIDESNLLSTLNTATGELFRIKQLPTDAKPASLLITRDHVYVPDTVAGRLYVLEIRTEELSSVAMPFVRLATAFAASPDGRLWIGTDGFGLVSYEATSRRQNVIDVGSSRITALGVDGLGRVWMGPRGRDGIELYDPLNGKLSELGLPRKGAATAFATDAQGRMWVGTDAGEIFAIRNNTLDASANVGGRVDDFVLGTAGDAWWVNRGATQVTYAPADGSVGPRNGPVGSSSPVFDAFGRSWTSDRPTGVFLVTLPGGGR